MERPEIKDKEVLKYVEYLEKSLRDFDPKKSVVKVYLTFKAYLDSLTEAVYTANQDTKKLMKDKNLRDMCDQYADNINKNTDTLISLEKKIEKSIDLTKEAELELEEKSAGILEDIIREEAEKKKKKENDF